MANVTGEVSRELKFTEITDGLRFPEGPIAMKDGSVIVVEIAAGRLTKVAQDGSKAVVAETGGGPNGAAMGPDGAIYVCNNGGFDWVDRDGRLFPGNQASDYVTGSIQRVDIETGKVTTLYTECDGEHLSGPNDIVFDRQGGFWFTDLGKTNDRIKIRGAIYYAKPDGSSIKKMIYPLDSPNGIGLSPDEKTLYAADTPSGRLWSWEISSPGELAGGGRGGQVVWGLSGHQLLDSMAVEANGSVCVATIMNGGVTRFAPDGTGAEHIPFPDRVTTNICFGGKDLRTAFITLSSTGKLVKADWPEPGLPLNFLNT